MKKVLSLFIMTIALFSNITNAQEVKLLQATSVIDFSFQSFFSGDVLVENLAYDKKVTIVTRINGDKWLELKANYEETLANGLERWSFKEANIYIDAEYQFAIKYEVDGQTFWDNNSNADYYLTKVEGGRVESNFILPPEFALRNLKTDNWKQQQNGIYSLYGTLYLQNLGDDKLVDIIYSTDNWQTNKTVAAHFTRKNNDDSAERWTYFIETDIENAHVEFAIRYRVNGNEYWDNNFGRNYSR